MINFVKNDIFFAGHALIVIALKCRYIPFIFKVKDFLTTQRIQTYHFSIGIVKKACALNLKKKLSSIYKI